MEAAYNLQNVSVTGNLMGTGDSAESCRCEESGQDWK
jgi:hypothetical protein